MRKAKLKVLHKLFSTLVEQGADPIGLSHELKAVEDNGAYHGHFVGDAAMLVSAFVWDKTPQGSAYWSAVAAAHAC